MSLSYPLPTINYTQTCSNMRKPNTVKIVNAGINNVWCFVKLFSPSDD